MPVNEPEITSRSNQHVQQGRAVREGKIEDLVFVEGLRLAEEAQRAGARITDLFFTRKFADENIRGSQLIRAANEAGSAIHLVSPGVLESLADTRSPAGVILLVRRPETGPQRLAILEGTAPLLVIGHRINNPANAGAILRTAEAAGASGVILTQDTADVFSPKGLRGAMGSSFRLPMWTGANFEAAIDWCRTNDIVTVATDANASTEHNDHDWTQRSALILGAEGTGLASDEVAAADAAIRIPMQEPVESLNVAVAAGIILYEARRQRS